MAAGLAQGLAGNDEARTFDETFINRPHETVVRSSGIAHGGEAAHEKCSQDARGADGGQRRGRHRVGGDVDQSCDHVHVAVDQPGHQCPAGKIDPGGACGRDRSVRDLLDAIVLDKHLKSIQERVAVRVEQLTAGEQVGHRRRSRALVALVHLTPHPLLSAGMP